MDYILDIIKSVASVMFLQKLLIFFFSSRQLTWFSQPVDCLEMSNSPNLSHLLVLAGLPGACLQTAIVERNDVEISETLE